MGQERLSEALSRIERALARVEAAAGRPSAPTSADPDLELRQAHETLRGKVESVIVQLDRLLEPESAG
jgi:hypothetical protein